MAISRTTWPFARGTAIIMGLLPTCGSLAPPRRQICQRVGPANSDDSGIGRLPAVAATAHPVIGIGQSHAANPLLTRERDRSVHAPVSVQIAGTAFSVPSLQRTKACYQLRLGINFNDSILNHPYELRKAVQAMRIDPSRLASAKSRAQRQARCRSKFSLSNTRNRPSSNSS